MYVTKLQNNVPYFNHGAGREGERQRKGGRGMGVAGERGGEERENIVLPFHS